jgi:hypothetical protein
MCPHINSVNSGMPVINNKARLFGSMQKSKDGVPIGSGSLAGDLGGITIWTPWSNHN